MAEATPARWTGTLTAKSGGLFPRTSVYGHPGLVRFCSTHTTTKSPSGEEVITIQWFQEKLLAMDTAHRCFTYQILENNVGITYCKSTVKRTDNGFVIIEIEKPDSTDYSRLGCPLWKLLLRRRRVSVDPDQLPLQVLQRLKVEDEEWQLPTIAEEGTEIIEKGTEERESGNTSRLRRKPGWMEDYVL
ncbi:hypothetical protein Acr_00g0016290 [Actinidia rufa]|uniref:Uncharacterized protein n=1 Tax=Actinidia rufa TaxID=165716 RepID=A0A7J0DAU8_9ERIC|nr:hypothetical protein Acr_00g0016290 [Actinidia rufa]